MSLIQINKQYCSCPFNIYVCTGKNEILGSGAFGVVFKGDYNNKAVAIKTVNPINSAEGNLKTLYEEVKIMCHLGVNEYIVSLVGASTVGLKEGKLFALFEFCPLGSLLNYLRMIRRSDELIANLVEDDAHLASVSASNDSIQNGLGTSDGSFSSRNLILWSFQISKGMEYLREKQVEKQSNFT
jgi:serine/threonine protein kinase